MLIGDVRPTTLDGIKSLATQFRKQQGIKHTSALDLAAKAASFENFRHAQRELPTQEQTRERSYVFLTIYWCDKKQGHRIGRETLRVELSRPILDICGRLALKHVRGFYDLRMAADDHFVCDKIAGSQSFAREQLCTAERSLRFMEHTGLRPAYNYRKTFRKAFLMANTLPNRGHTTYWVDPENGQHILVDEPYGGKCDEEERAAWADQNSWLLIKAKWPGMYNPYNCGLYIATDGRSSYDIVAIAAKINAMPKPLVERDWPGESSSSWETFVSPLAKTAQDVRRARCRGTIYPTASAKTVPYSYDIGWPQRRRPAGRMGIDGHVEVGRIVKAIIYSDQRPYRVYNLMNALRSTLEDWMGCEIVRGQLDGADFFEVYYTGVKEDVPYLERARSRTGIVAMLGELKQKLLVAYPDCLPLRQQLHRIDASATLINKMR
ncbi:DUF5623 domain-containing protein [Ferrovibrio sp.]|uniref:DUF5623 domain-containing protein n=1 Tax=Ferrovibrio sp. TaxID=1917215 RepID=UPI0035B268C9